MMNATNQATYLLCTHLVTVVGQQLFSQPTLSARLTADSQ